MVIKSKCTLIYVFAVFHIFSCRKNQYETQTYLENKELRSIMEEAICMCSNQHKMIYSEIEKCMHEKLSESSLKKDLKQSSKKIQFYFSNNAVLIFNNNNKIIEDHLKIYSYESRLDKCSQEKEFPDKDIYKIKSKNNLGLTRMSELMIFNNIQNIIVDHNNQNVFDNSELHFMPRGEERKRTSVLKIVQRNGAWLNYLEKVSHRNQNNLEEITFLIIEFLKERFKSDNIIFEEIYIPIRYYELDQMEYTPYE